MQRLSFHWIYSFAKNASYQTEGRILFIMEQLDKRIRHQLAAGPRSVKLRRNLSARRMLKRELATRQA